MYYWRNDKTDCHGPAIVVGKDGQQVLLKHGGVYIRVHPCRMQLCEEQSDSSQNKQQPNTGTDHQQINHPDDSCDYSESFSSDDDDAYATADDGSDDNEDPV